MFSAAHVVSRTLSRMLSSQSLFSNQKNESVSLSNDDFACVRSAKTARNRTAAPAKLAWTSVSLAVQERSIRNVCREYVSIQFSIHRRLRTIQKSPQRRNQNGAKKQIKALLKRRRNHRFQKTKLARHQQQIRNGSLSTQNSSGESFLPNSFQSPQSFPCRFRVNEQVSI